MNQTDTRLHLMRSSAGGRAEPAAEPMGDDSIDLLELLTTLWRGKFWIMLCALIGLGLGIWYAFFLAVPLYSSSTTIAFESREESIVDLENVMGGLGGDQQTVNTEVEVLRSRNLMEKVVLELDLVNDPEFNAELRPDGLIAQAITFVRTTLGAPTEDELLSERAILDEVIDELLEQVGVSNVRQSFVFRVSATTESPQKSAAIVNSIADFYIRDQVDVKLAATEEATAWLSDRVAILQVDLEKAVEAVKEFNVTSDLISAEVLEAMNRQIKDLRDRRRDALASLDLINARISSMEAARNAEELETMAELAADRSLSRSLELIRAGTITSPDAFFERYEIIVDRLRQSASRTSDQATAFESSIAELERQVTQQSDDLVTLEQLEREAEASRLIYEYFLARLKETSVQQGIQQADSRVLSPAVIARDQSSPRTMIVLAMSLILGTMAGSGLVLGRELAQNTIRTPDELEKLTGHTVLGQIPLIPTRRRKKVLQYLADKPTSAAAEAVRNLRTSTLLTNIDNPPQVIMSTSSLPGEGKTTQSLSLAQNLSGLGKTVLLIEGDIRRRVFSEYFDLKGQPGMLSVLSGEKTLAEAAKRVEILGADVLLGEKSNTNAADVFSSNRFTNFLNEAREAYDYIIIDTPPVLVVPDARVIGQNVDAILYSVKWDDTTKKQVAAGLRSFETVNIRVTGLVLSQINPKGMKRYGHTEYGNYGHGYYDN